MEAIINNIHVGSIFYLYALVYLIYLIMYALKKYEDMPVMETPDTHELLHKLKDPFALLMFLNMIWILLGIIFTHERLLFLALATITYFPIGNLYDKIPYKIVRLALIRLQIYIYPAIICLLIMYKEFVK